MKREDIHKLVGGYAAGILTEQERRELFSAALEDQELFNELMREEPLRELLADPSNRVELRQALEKPESARRWWWWAAPAAAALATAAFAILLIRPPEPPEPVRMAQAPKPPDFAVAIPPMTVTPPKRKAATREAQPPPSAADQAEKILLQPRAVTGFVAPVPSPFRGDMERALVMRSATGARAAYYGTPDWERGIVQRTVSTTEPRMGLRYSREGGVLTVEPNVATRLRVFDGEHEIFNSTFMPRERRSVPAPEGKPLRITLDRSEAAPAASPRLLEERDAGERATYVVAEPGVASMTVTVP